MLHTSGTKSSMRLRVGARHYDADDAVNRANIIFVAMSVSKLTTKQWLRGIMLTLKPKGNPMPDGGIWIFVLIAAVLWFCIRTNKRRM
jgi:hypothetical protein